jgi:protoporphyrinogen oxidase
VGGGVLGLTFAHRAAQAGHRVTLIEGAPQVGGLASAWTLGDVMWDRHYHVTLLSDAWTRGILRELGLEQEMRWVETRTGYYAEGRLSSVSDTIEFLRLPTLSPLSKLRLGATILAGSRIRRWRRLEQIPVSEWLTRWSGRQTYEQFWLPLLRAKLGDSADAASAAFIWATIQRLYAARRTGLKKELFGYVPGGYARILERFADRLRDEGVTLELGTPATRIERDGDSLVVGVGDERLRFDDVVVTANPGVAARICAGLTADEIANLDRIRYQGIVCVSVLLRRPLSPFYLTYITDDVPFTAVVEMSAFVDRAQFGGNALVYLPKYVAPDDPLLTASDAEIAGRFLPALRRMHPDLADRDVLELKVSRVREVFPVPTIRYSHHVPPMATSVPGLHLVNSAQIVNGTLNVNETVQLAERAARALVTEAAGAPFSATAGERVPA